MVHLLPHNEEVQDHLLEAVLPWEEVYCSLCAKETKCDEEGRLFRKSAQSLACGVCPDILQ